MIPVIDRLRVAVADHYAVERELGRGGMAAVFLAEDRKHGRRVAIKVLDPDLAAVLGADRFLREIEIAAGLTHPHILPLYDSGQADGLLYYVMPFVEGESLRGRLEREKQLPVAEALRIAREVADGLSYAHALGVIHRDIKPENILLSGGHAVIADFGIARAVTAAGGERLTATGVAVGTAAYMSPEQALGERDLDGRCDLYSLGCVLYEMLVGAPPFAAPTAQGVLARRLSEAVPSMRAVRESVSDALDAVVRRALAKVPADRFTTAVEFAAALGPGGEEPPAPRAARDRSRRSLLIGALAAAALGGVVLTAVRLRGRAPAPLEPAAAGATPGIAVLPFRVTGPNLEFWREGIVDMLSFNLEGIGGLRKIDPVTVMAAWSRRNGEDREVVPAVALEVARRVAARYAILGSAVEVGSAVRLTAEMYDVARAEILGTAQVDGPADSVLRLVDRLSVELVRQGLIRSADRLPAMNLSAVTTTSVPALKAYLVGERWYRRAQFARAAEGFQRAVDLDSTFARAAFRLASAYGWLGAGDLAVRYGSQAARFADRLPERDAVLVRLGPHYRPQNLAVVEQLTNRYPDDVDAWQDLGENAFHAGGLALLPASAFREALEKAVDLFPHYGESYIHLIEDAFVRRDSARVRALIAASQAIDSAQPPCPGYGVVAALTWGSAEERGRAAAALATMTEANFACGWTTIAAAPAAVDRAERDDRARLRARGSASRAPALLWRMLQARLMNGHLAAVRRLLAEGTAAPAAAIFAHRWTVMLHLSGFSDSTGARAAVAPMRRHGGFDDYFWLGALAAAEARWTDVERASQAIVARGHALTAAGDSTTAAFARATAQALREYVRLRHGEWDRLAPFEDALRRVDPMGFQGEYPGKYLRYQVGGMLLDAGRSATAERYYESFYQYDWEYYVQAQYYLGRILEARGERDAAAEHYARFVEWWRDCDPELRPWWEEGREALRRLSGEPVGAGRPARR